MSRLHTTLSIAALGLLSSIASAQFAASASGPINSFGYLGNPANGSFTRTYSGPSTIFTSLAFSGRLTSVAGATWESDSLWNVTGTGVGPGYQLMPSGNGPYSAPVDINVSTKGLFWFQGGASVNFGAFQDSNAPNTVQASWTNVSFNYSNSISHVASLGTFVNPSSLTFDTNGSTGISDTHIALYTASGTKLFEDDDSGTDLLSSISTTNLAHDNYILVIGSFQSTFADGFAIPGVDSLNYGAYNLNVNGSSVGTGTIAAGEFKTYSFQVVPEPGTMAVVGLGVAALLRRRRK
ncbi:MAG: PEP-CTERM sorting domain-containing protein [Armatimonadota bacterium]